MRHGFTDMSPHPGFLVRDGFRITTMAQVVLPRLKGRHGAILGLKSMSGRVFGSTTFPDVAYLINGKVFDASYNVISGNQRIMDTLFRYGDQVVFKEDNSSKGNGVMFFERDVWFSARLPANSASTRLSHCTGKCPSWPVSARMWWLTSAVRSRSWSGTTNTIASNSAKPHKGHALPTSIGSGWLALAGPWRTGGADRSCGRA